MEVEAMEKKDQQDPGKIVLLGWESIFQPAYGKNTRHNALLKKFLKRAIV